MPFEVSIIAEQFRPPRCPLFSDNEQLVRHYTLHEQLAFVEPQQQDSETSYCTKNDFKRNKLVLTAFSH